MRKAVVNANGIVDNVIEILDGVVYPLAQGSRLVEDPTGIAAPGGTWNGTTFTPPPAPTPTNRDVIEARALVALAANDTYLANPSPSPPQVVAQVTVLTRECSALIRLLLNQLETTAGT